MNAFTKSLLTTAAVAVLYAGACTNLSANQENKMKTNPSIDDKVNTDTNACLEYYVGGKKASPARIKAKHPYFCLAFIQQILQSLYTKKFCVENGIIGDGERIGGTWNLFNNLRDNGYVVWEKNEAQGEYSSETLKRLKKENKKDSYSSIITKLKETNTREAEEIAKDLFNQGYVIVMGSHNPLSMFKGNYVTHIYMMIGTNKKGEIIVYNEWGCDIEKMKISDLYRRVPGGIDIIVALPNPRTMQKYSSIKTLNESTTSTTPVTSL